MGKFGREDKVKTLRLLEIDRLIREGTYPNATTLGKKFEVSRSTIMRDIDFLRDRYCAPLEYDSEKNGYFYTDSTFFIKSVMLTEGELFTVSAIMPLLEQYKNTPLEESIKNILAKIIEMLPQEISIDSAYVTKDISFISDPLPKIDEEIFNAIFQAVKIHNSITFEYRSLRSQLYNERTMDPYHVICQKGNWYLIGFCHHHQEIRVFSLARMRNLKCLQNHFEIPQDFDLNKHIDVALGIWNNVDNPEKIELLFSPEINTYILERQWHPSQEMYQNEDGTVYLSFMSNQFQETLYWVLSFGSSVKVLNPPKLIEKVKEEARKILEN